MGYAESALEASPRLCVVNKFGKQEIDGKGFRPLIGRALADDIPVVCAVGATHLDGFRAFAGEMAEQVSPDVDAILAWIDNTAAAEV